MKLYFSISAPGLLKDYDLVNYLCSYHYFSKKAKLFTQLQQSDSLFIDSGAYSAWNSGKAIDIDAFGLYLQKLEQAANYTLEYAGLDVIGDAEGTYRNNKYLEQKYGLKPIITFHIGENFDYLKRIVAEGYEHIALGGMVGKIRPLRDAFLDQSWNIILSENPSIKVHGFGMTDVYLMEKFPWFSVDSTSYNSGTMFGSMLMHSPKGKLIQVPTDKYFIDTYGKESLKDKKFVREEVMRVGIETYKRIERDVTEYHKGRDFNSLKTFSFL